MGLTKDQPSSRRSLWHRRPATCLVAAYALAALVWLGWKTTQGNSLAALFFTAEQRAQLALNEGDYGAAAGFFPDAYRQGLAQYYAEDFETAIETLSEVDSTEGLFALANAYGQARNYLYSLYTYDLVLERDPDHAAAIHNREIVNRIVEEMKLMGDSQQQGENDPKRSQEINPPPGMDDDMEEHNDIGPRPPPEQWTADQLLNDPEMADLWMQQVQSDPADFLATKFAIQQDARTAPPPAAETETGEETE